MTYEVKTPILAESIDYTRKAVKGVLEGGMEPKEANVVLSGARALQGAVRTDITARLAAPRIQRAEKACT